MSEYTPFAGLYKLGPGEPISLNNYEFFENETIIDNMFNAFVTHRHDNHAPVQAFASSAIASASAAGGNLAAGDVWYIGITALDSYSGETTAVISSATVPGSATNPTIGPTAAAIGSGFLNLGTYRYAYTFIDAQGESLLSPQVNVTLPQNGRAVLGLTSTSQSKMIYRAFGFGDFHKIGSASGAALTFTDDGSLCVSCDQQPPDENTLALSGKITIYRPTMPASAVSWRVYVSEEADLPTPAALYAYSASALRDIPSAVTSVEFTSPQQIRLGTPPHVSRTIPGASFIYAQDVLYNGDNNQLASGTVDSALDFIGNHFVHKMWASSVLNLSSASANVAISGPVVKFGTIDGGIKMNGVPGGSAINMDAMRISFRGSTVSGNHNNPADLTPQHTEKRDYSYRFQAPFFASAYQDFNYDHYTVEIGMRQGIVLLASSSSPHVIGGYPVNNYFYVGSGVWGASSQGVYLPYNQLAGHSVTIKTIASGLASGLWQVRASGSDLIEQNSSAWASARWLNHLESFEFIYFPQSVTGDVGRWFIK